MPTFRRLTGIFVTLAAIALPVSVSGADGDARIASANAVPLQRIAAVSGGMASQGAIDLDRITQRSGLEARLKLAGVYASGDGSQSDYGKAFNIYQRIVDDHADITANDPAASGVAHAFVALGNYLRTGIPGASIKADKGRALMLIWHAASYLGDAEAQSNLAQMLLDGEGIARNGRLAVNWLANAAKKRHARSQAILGNILWRGAPDIRRQPMKGLALLTLARQNAGTKKEALWIDDLLAGAKEQASAAERDGAARLVALWKPHFGQQLDIAARSRKAPAYDNLTKFAPISGRGGLTKVGLESAPAKR